jgi:hypothetical protein
MTLLKTRLSFLKMVCAACETKLNKIAVPDKWKDGARNVVGPIKAGGGKTNKVLSKLKSQWIPNENCCRLCKTKVQEKYHYCNDCAHKKGICTMCGKRAVDVSAHKMSLT